MKIERKTDEELRAWADDFRASFAPDAVPPIDVIYIAEIDMGLEIIPTPQLFSKIGMDAALASDLNTVYVDEQSYMKWEAGQHWIEKRMRFSFAHELGHRVLHGDLIKGDGFQTLEDFKRWAGSPENYRTAEYQANEFAGRLLVPIDLLNQEFDRYRAEVEKLPDWREIEGMREYIAKKIAPRFGVNHQVIEVRFDREGIWPVN
jgi:Zn-dependent peptidase ImmA (M78 family)